MGNFKYNNDGICSYAPIYLFQHPDYCNFNLFLLAFIMVSGYGLLLLGNRLDAEKEKEKESKRE
ncbi:hypothetical protein PGT21_011147 [Puccinia graminis f. sp. tritici]|uniref:Uncharacterized protein n=2 Tax=Puccinia graminis f. sp. tritici TaxID=56615 RepID=H6QS32_PUCGT|nr:uncharacterized protein PGTG_21607 [Puccinia graminis f. sp. tritici CRL 75-36-700-3]EHS63478.1 hypothetical protein PGTG_21607 [Puccinia graminis f. sp. tritici CRL 75-36-700-3]KAA1085559.1 hypothetical protein PGT21_011147 [Puccinia graminis f. sp. tritici]KAA1135968.1 hypothetical protein PGTUg99_013618 [Puccinia graminis f. sp. tritici]